MPAKLRDFEIGAASKGAEGVLSSDEGAMLIEAAAEIRAKLGC
jgi:hypothetical protein